MYILLSYYKTKSINMPSEPTCITYKSQGWAKRVRPLVFMKISRNVRGQAFLEAGRKVRRKNARQRRNRAAHVGTRTELDPGDVNLILFAYLYLSWVSINSQRPRTGDEFTSEIRYPSRKSAELGSRNLLLPNTQPPRTSRTPARA